LAELGKGGAEKKGRRFLNSNKRSLYPEEEEKKKRKFLVRGEKELGEEDLG